MNKPILCLDFDGVIHSYSSGWKGAATIPDAPVPGALEFIVTALDRFRVSIFSSRTHQWGGRRAMKAYLKRELVNLEEPDWWQRRVMRTAFADPWDEEVDNAARIVVKEISWPFFKPPALVTIDDRALTFTGEWPTLESIAAFQPWNKRPRARPTP